MTEIVFATADALLAEVRADPLLGRYSALVVDHVAERTASTDLLLALLRKVRFAARSLLRPPSRLSVFTTLRFLRRSPVPLLQLANVDYAAYPPVLSRLALPANALSPVAWVRDIAIRALGPGRWPDHLRSSAASPLAASAAYGLRMTSSCAMRYAQIAENLLMTGRRAEDYKQCLTAALSAELWPGCAAVHQIGSRSKHVV